MRPVELARLHGLSAQAVRNYEEIDALPPARRTAAGYRIYTETHVLALNAFLALVAAVGHRTARGIMVALHDDQLDVALSAVDHAHEQLLRDRETLATVATAVTAVQEAGPERIRRRTGTLRIGELAGRLGVSPATLRHWETEEIVHPHRETPGGQRVYSAEQIRDAELAHLLRRGGHGLGDIAQVLAAVRRAGESGAVPDALATALAASEDRLRSRGLTLLAASAELSRYLAPRDPPTLGP